MSNTRNTTSRATMRRHVAKAGGYYSAQTRQWVLPGARHNCAPFAVDTAWFSSLEDAFAAADEHATRAAQVLRFGEAEAKRLREVRS